MGERAIRSVNGYIDAWNEHDVDLRKQLLTQVMTDDGAYVDPNTNLDTRDGLVEYIGQVLGKSPGRRVVRTSNVDVHHSVCRFNWRLIKADGTQGTESIDFIEFASDGRIQRVVGFFGPLEAL
jgi:hypothetical protein